MRKSVEVTVFRRGWVTLNANFRQKVVSIINHCWCQKTRMIALSSDIQNIRSVLFGFVTKHACDTGTDRITTAIAYSCSRGK